MTELASFTGPDGTCLNVEVADEAPGPERISRDRDGTVRAGQRRCSPLHPSPPNRPLVTLRHHRP